MKNKNKKLAKNKEKKERVPVHFRFFLLNHMLLQTLLLDGIVCTSGNTTTSTMKRTALSTIKTTMKLATKSKIADSRRDNTCSASVAL